MIKNYLKSFSNLKLKNNIINIQKVQYNIESIKSIGKIIELLKENNNQFKYNDIYIDKQKLALPNQPINFENYKLIIKYIKNEISSNNVNEIIDISKNIVISLKGTKEFNKQVNSSDFYDLIDTINDTYYRNVSRIKFDKIQNLASQLRLVSDMDVQVEIINSIIVEIVSFKYNELINQINGEFETFLEVIYLISSIKSNIIQDKYRLNFFDYLIQIFQSNDQFILTKYDISQISNLIYIFQRHNYRIQKLNNYLQKFISKIKFNQINRFERNLNIIQQKQQIYLIRLLYQSIQLDLSTINNNVTVSIINFIIKQHQKFQKYMRSEGHLKMLKSLISTQNLIEVILINSIEYLSNNLSDLQNHEIINFQRQLHILLIIDPIYKKYMRESILIDLKSKISILRDHKSNCFEDDLQKVLKSIYPKQKILRNVKINDLEFDFQIVDLNLYIELDGSYHFYLDDQYEVTMNNRIKKKFMKLNQPNTIFIHQKDLNSFQKFNDKKIQVQKYLNDRILL